MSYCSFGIICNTESACVPSKPQNNSNSNSNSNPGEQGDSGEERPGIGFNFIIVNSLRLADGIVEPGKSLGRYPKTQRTIAT